MAENTLEMPEAVKKALEENPELLKQLASPEFINSINSQLGKVTGLADWCVACGASASAAIPGSDVINPPSIDEIREIGRRLTFIR